MKQTGIYKIFSIIKPERCYVGSSCMIHTRWMGHLNFLRKGTHHSPKLQNHYNKYGESDLVFEIIEPCFPDWVIIREQYYIDKLKPYFNICQSATSRRGVKQSPEAIAKRVAKTKGRIPPQSERDNISKANKGKMRTPEMRKAQSVSQKKRYLTSKHPCIGKICSVETRRKIGEKNKGHTGGWNKGIPQTEGAKRNQSLKMKGKLAGEKNPNFGKHLTPEQKLKMSEYVKQGLLRKKEYENYHLKIA